MAQKLYDGLKQFPFVQCTQQVESNQLFRTMPRAIIDAMLNHYFFYFWNEEVNEVRLVTSFDTTIQDIEAFLEQLKRYASK